MQLPDWTSVANLTGQVLADYVGALNAILAGKSVNL